MRGPRALGKEALWEKTTARRWGWVLLIAVPILLFFISFTLGKYPISIPDFFTTIYHHFACPSAFEKGQALEHLKQTDAALFNIRLPRVLAVMLVGAGLSVAGAAYQGMFKNPIVSPDILGASAGAGFGAALGILLSLANTYIQLLAFVGGIVAVVLTMVINRGISKEPLLGLVLGGVMITNLFTAFNSYVKLVADKDEKLPAITFWLMGGFNAINMQKFLSILLPIGVSVIVLFLLRWRLNVFSFGEEEARTMGVRTSLTRNIVIIAATLITASSVSVAGMVGWVGLVIPHLGRILVGPNFGALIPASSLLGAAYLLIVDNIARNLWAIEIPIGILTAVIGVPVFILVYRASARR